MTDKQRAARKRYEKCRNRNHHRRPHGGVSRNKYSKAPTFYRKQESVQNQRWFAKLISGVFRKKG